MAHAGTRRGDPAKRRVDQLVDVQGDHPQAMGGEEAEVSPRRADGRVCSDAPGELFILLDIPLGKYAHAHFGADGPFCDVAVWIAAVVRETPFAPALRGIDELSRVMHIRSKLL